MLQNLLTEWSRLLLGSLQEAGVSQVVVSPGSRSTPFVLAATSCPGLCLSDGMDERAAAFFALGQGRVTGKPTLLLCTSGSAPAHYLPALIEARAAHVPLLVLSADRPFDQVACGAPQTIDQSRLFGVHAKAFFEIGLPGAASSSLRALRRVCVQAVQETLRSPSGPPGPVHLNARADKPLEPRMARSNEEIALAEAVTALLQTPVPLVAHSNLAPDGVALDQLAESIGKTERGLVVVGPYREPLTQTTLVQGDLHQMARATGFPLITEAASGMRFVPGDPSVPTCDAFPLILRTESLSKELAPELILQIGPQPTATGWETFLAQVPSCKQVVIDPHGFQDPGGNAHLHLLADPHLCLSGLVHRLCDSQRSGPRTHYAEKVARVAQSAWAVAETVLEQAPPDAEAHLVRAAVSALPRGSVLMVGNSLPIRFVDLFCRPASADVLVLSQRGASGIDGLISGAAGAASVMPRPVTLLLGDVSFLHDLSGLPLCHKAQRSLAIVVLNNGGGRIFETLPVGKMQGIAPSLSHFTTPHRWPLHHAAALFGHPYVAVHDRESLSAALKNAHERPGTTVIEAQVNSGSGSAAATLADLDQALRTCRVMEA